MTNFFAVFSIHSKTGSSDRDGPLGGGGLGPSVHRKCPRTSLGPSSSELRGLEFCPIWAKIDPKWGIPARVPFFRFTVKLAVWIAPGLLEVEEEVPAYTGNVSESPETPLPIWYRWSKNAALGCDPPVRQFPYCFLYKLKILGRF